VPIDLDFPANPHLKTPESSQRTTQPQTAGVHRARQPLFRQSTSTTDVRSVPRPKSATSSISLGQPTYHPHTSSQHDNPTQPLPPSSNPGSASADNPDPCTTSGSRLSARPRSSAGVPRPQGTAGQESSRSHRAAKKKAKSKQMALIHLPAKMRRSTEFARSRRNQCGAPGSSTVQPRRPSPPDLMEENEEERVTQEALARGKEPVRTFTVAY
jgi:hypothetical protein